MSAGLFAPRVHPFLLLFTVLGEGRARLVYAKWSVASLLTVKLNNFGSFSLKTQLWLLWGPPGCPGVSGCLLDASWVPPGCLLGASWVPPGWLLGVSWVAPGCLLDASWLLLPLWEPPGWPGVSGCLLDASWVPLGCLLGGSWVSPGCLLAASWACPGWLLVNPPQDYLAAFSWIANTPTVWGLTLESYLPNGAINSPFGYKNANK